MGFLTNPPSRQLPKKHWWYKTRWALTGKLVYKDKDGELHVVPTGFEHDYASIPRFLWPILPPTGPYSRSAILHDFNHDDKMFYRAMKGDGTPKWLAKIMYWAVTHDSLPDDYDVTDPGDDNSILGG